MEKIFKTYIHIIKTFLDGYLSLILFESIYTRLIKLRMRTSDDILITTVFVSTYNTAVLMLSNLINPNPDSIDCFYLINIIRENRKSYSDPHYEKLEEEISNFESYLNENTKFAERIKTIRDKHVGHLDRKHVNDPSSIELDLPIKFGEINDHYSLIREHLQRIGPLIDPDADPSGPLALLDQPTDLLTKKAEVLFDS